MRRHRLAIVLIACAAAVLARAHPGYGQERVRLDARALECAASYYQAASEYRAGDLVAALDRVDGLDREALKTVLIAIDRAASQPTDATLASFQWGVPLLRAAGMLHIEAAVRALRFDRAEDFRFHNAVAVQVFAVADRPTGSEPAGTFGIRSARAVGRALLGASSIELGRAYLGIATRRFPRDPELLLVLGTLLEAGGETAPRRFDGSTDLRGARTEREFLLQEASRVFERTLEADPNLIEARVRLARVYTLTARDTLASSLLEEVIKLHAESVGPEGASTAHGPALWVYLARLLLGDVHQRAGRTSDALALYREARAMPGRGQAAFIALSQLLLQLGDQAAAADVLDELFATQRTSLMWEPWWEYPFGQPPLGFQMIIELREEVQRS